MKKIILTIILLLQVFFIKAQVGIGTNTPEATLDIKAKSTNDTNDIEGLLVPRVSKDKAFKMATNGTLLKESTMIYVDDISDYSGTDSKVMKITKKGYYFWRDGKWTAEWNTDSRNIFNSDGTISEARTVTLSGNNRKLNFEGGEINIKGNSSFPLIINSENRQGVGISIHPNDLRKKVEFKATKQGDIKISANGDKIFIERSSGNVGIGTTSPQQKLDVTGNAKIAGNLEVTNSIKQTSDRKFKEKIQPLEKGISYISALNPVTYFWNEMGVERGGDKDIQQIGFIAQEMEQVLPGAVGTDKQGNKSINYIQIIPILTKAVQELKDENQMLREEIQKLKERITLVENIKN